MTSSISVTLCAEVPELGESPGALSWSMVEAWAVAMREQVPAAALAASLEQVQDQLIDRVCGPRWLPVRGLPAPFACPGCGVMQDFARKASGPARAASTRRWGRCACNWPTWAAATAVGCSPRCC